MIRDRSSRLCVFSVHSQPCAYSRGIFDTEDSPMSTESKSSSSQPRSPGSDSNENETENTSGDENDTSASRTDTHRPPLPLADLLTRETDRKFVGLTENDSREYPDEVPPETRCSAANSRSFKEAIQALPKASSGELWATNDLALNALGYDVKFRWQIASDSYSIINPQEAYLPIISALQQRGETNPFGWVSYRDWGGLFKMVVICPSLRHVVSGDQGDIEDDVEEDGITIAVSNDSDSDEDSNKDEEGSETIIYGGFQTGYDFRGTQTLWARPVLFLPDSGTVLPDMGERYTRRHYGKATNADHERSQGRVPISEWWRSIYDDIDTRMIEVDTAIRRTRAIAYDFEDLPFSVEDCYTYWGIAFKYAERAADRAISIAKPSSRPTVFNLQLSLLIAVLQEYEGSMASDTYQEYLEVAGELFRKPAMMIQLAMQEHDRQTDDPDERVIPEDQQTLSDALDDIVDIPGITVDSEADLSDGAAQRLQDRVQRRLDDIESVT